MKVVYVGNYRVSHSTETHVAASLEANGHEVIRVQEGDEGCWDDAAELADAHRAAWLMWTHTHQYGPEAAHPDQLRMIERARGYGVPTVAFHLDRYVGLEREHQIDDEPFWRMDLVVTADGGHDAVFAAKGVNHVWMPPAVYDAECAPGHVVRKYQSRLAFMGSFPYPHPQWHPYRSEVITMMRRRYGGRFRTWPRGQAIRGADLNNFYASVQVMIGDSCLVPDADGTPCTRYWSDRVPETLGRGGFLIHPWVEGFEEHGFIDRETLVTYPLGDLRALREQVDFYLRNEAERERIKAAGRELVLERHTYRVRMEAVARLVDAMAAPFTDLGPVEKPVKKAPAKKAPAKKKAVAS